MTDDSPARRIADHAARLAALPEAEVLRTLEAVEPLPNVPDLDPAWDDAAFERAELLAAVADEIGRRRLVEAIAPLYERAALDSAFEMMLSFRHGPEKAVAPEWGRLTAIMRPLAGHPRSGTRRWAVEELGILRDRDGLPELLAALGDPEPFVRAAACGSVEMLSAELDAGEVETCRALIAGLADDPSADVRSAAAHALRDL